MNNTAFLRIKTKNKTKGIVNDSLGQPTICRADLFDLSSICFGGMYVCTDARTDVRTTSVIKVTLNMGWPSGSKWGEERKEVSHFNDNDIREFL